MRQAIPVLGVQLAGELDVGLTLYDSPSSKVRCLDNVSLSMLKSLACIQRLS